MAPRQRHHPPTYDNVQEIKARKQVRNVALCYRQQKRSSRVRANAGGRRHAINEECADAARHASFAPCPPCVEKEETGRQQ